MPPAINWDNDEDNIQRHISKELGIEPQVYIGGVAYDESWPSEDFFFYAEPYPKDSG